MRGVTVTVGDAPARRDTSGDGGGVLVLHVAGDAGPRAVQQGDVIRSVDGHAIDAPRDFMEAVQERPANVALDVTVLRDGQELHLRVPPREESTRRS